MARIEPHLESGEASFEHGGRRYTLALTHLAWAAAQRSVGLVDGKALGRKELLQRIAQGFDLEGYALFYGMLQRHHSDIASLEEASVLMEAVGATAVDAMRLAMGLSAPDQRDLKELSDGQDPPQAQPKKRRKRTIENAISAPDRLG